MDAPDESTDRPVVPSSPSRSRSVPTKADEEKDTSNQRQPPRRPRRVVRRQSSIALFVSRIPSTVPFSTQPSSLWAWLPWALALIGGYHSEVRRQKTLTKAPLVFRQDTAVNEWLLKRMNCLAREMRPTLFVGTWAVLNSMLAYLKIGPRTCTKRDVFREVMTMSQDGAKVGLDWELPPESGGGIGDVSPGRPTLQNSSSGNRRRLEVLNGPIRKPVVLVLHGINNDSSFGYIRSAMRACSDRGWIAVGMNFRGCGGVGLATPRGYTGAYTGDLRCVVNKIAARLEPGEPLFLVGNSLGANLIVKYLGEEGMSNTLPKCVAGGVSLGNPLKIHSGRIGFPWGHVLGLGLKKMFWLHRREFQQMTCANFQSAFRKIFLASTVGEIDCHNAPFVIRNDPFHPFGQIVGYESGEHYWRDASSYDRVKYVSVPLLSLSSQDDFLVRRNAMETLSECLVNPNTIVVKTKTGGHLGWSEARGFDSAVFGGSWADEATVEFIDAIIQLRRQNTETSECIGTSPLLNNREEASADARQRASSLRSKL